MGGYVFPTQLCKQVKTSSLGSSLASTDRSYNSVDFDRQQTITDHGNSSAIVLGLKTE